MLRSLLLSIFTLLAGAHSASAEPATLQIRWVGDIAFDSSRSLPPGGPSRALRSLQPLLQSDLTLGNLEGTLGNSGTSKCSGGSNCYAFQAPSSYAQGFARLGFAGMNQANNHAYDAGAAGFKNTARSLQAAGIASIGARNTITRFTRNGISVAVVGFSPYPWSDSVLHLRRLTARVRRADERTDVVIVLAHLGAEGAAATHIRPGVETAFGEQRGDPQRFAHTAINAGADLVLASGPHVIRGIERYHNRLIAYSLGNFAGYHTLSTGGILSQSGILQLEVDQRGALVEGRWISLLLDQAGIPRRDWSNQAAQTVGALSRTDFGNARYRIRSNGWFDNRPVIAAHGS
jgi:hypothetical protein